MASYASEAVFHSSTKNGGEPVSAVGAALSPLHLPDTLLAQIMGFSTAEDMRNFYMVCKNALPEACFFLIVKNAVISFQSSLGHLFRNDRVSLSTTMSKVEFFERVEFLHKLRSNLTTHRHGICWIKGQDISGPNIRIFRLSGEDGAGRDQPCTVVKADLVSKNSRLSKSYGCFTCEEQLIYHIAGCDGNSEIFAVNDVGEVYRSFRSGVDIMKAWEVLPEFLAPRNRVLRVSAGYDHVLAITVNGECFTWGSDEEGKTGYGANGYAHIDMHKPYNVSNVGGHLETKFVVDCSAGGVHSLLLDSDGTAYSCGMGDGGALGHPTGKTFKTFTPIVFRKFDEQPKVCLVEAGRATTFLLLGNGSVYACGRGLNGQLGTGLCKDIYKPARVDLDVPVRFVRAGMDVNTTWFIDNSYYIWSTGRFFQSQARIALSPVKCALKISSVKVVDACVDANLVKVQSAQTPKTASFGAPILYQYETIAGTAPYRICKNIPFLDQGTCLKMFNCSEDRKLSCTGLPVEEHARYALYDTHTGQPVTLADKVHPTRCAYVVDNAFSAEYMNDLDVLRKDLELDFKRPTCARRFFKEWGGNPHEQGRHTENGWVGRGLEGAFRRLGLPFFAMPWFRFLEYSTGGCMDKHTDGSNTHTIEGKTVRSTHTMLVYLQDCDDGGETALFQKKEKQKKALAKKQKNFVPKLIVNVKPKKNRLLIFPHPCLHEGCIVRLQRKVCLRAELYFCNPDDDDQLVSWYETQQHPLKLRTS